MCNSRAALVVVSLLHLVVVLVSGQGSGTKSQWKTLSGAPPLVVARGGFSGLFPDSSIPAYSSALMTSVRDVQLWCDVQLTKDGVGICLPDVKLDNSTDIGSMFPSGKKQYTVNGVQTTGWFSIDFSANDLANVALIQPIFSRSNKFDKNFFAIATVDDIVGLSNPAPGVWLNIQHNAFFAQHNLSMRNYVSSVSRTVDISYISSPELTFLSSIRSSINRNVTKLVFRFLDKAQIEPTTEKSYGSLLKNLTLIRTVASVILVPKDYIWPVGSDSYLQPHTSLVSDAHKAGLEIVAANFVNDFPLSYNYSFDPIAEYLNFIDNGEFSVDGVLTDFPVSSSSAIDCYAHVSANATKQVRTLVISKFGSSGDYPGCTDLAYTKAINDGVDVLDCPVQISSDGIPFCLSSINLADSTNAAQSFTDRITQVPEIMSGDGIFAFNFTWAEIQKDLKPVLASPQKGFTLFRNPRNLNAGNFVTLANFLNLANASSSLSGVLISIENAAYLAEKQGLSVVDTVLATLRDSGFNDQTKIKVMIQSTSSSVLEKFKSNSNYEKVYKIEEEIRDFDAPTMKDIASFASSVVVVKSSVFPDNQLFLTTETNVVQKLHSQNLTVYAETFSNEFVSQAWDFFSDATVEINTFVSAGNIDGVITDFPKTSDRYRRNLCLNLGDNIPSYMSPVQPGSLLSLIIPSARPPAEAPSPVWTVADTDEAPRPSATARTPPPGTAAPAPGQTRPNSQSKMSVRRVMSSLAMLFASIVLF